MEMKSTRIVTPKRAAAAAVAAGLGIAFASTLDPTPPANDPVIELAALTPVVSSQGMVSYQDLNIPPQAQDDIISVGVTATGLAITYNGDGPGHTVIVFNQSGTQLASFDKVIGMALTDSSSETVSFVQDTAPELPPEGEEDPVEGEPGVDFDSEVVPSSDIVAVSASTGQELGRIPAAHNQLVLAVGSGKVALGDGDESHLWTPGSAPKLLGFVPDDFYIVGLTADRIVTTNLDGITRIHNYAGVLVQQVGDLVSWSVSRTLEALAGATTDGLVTTVNLVTGEVQVMDPTIEAISATYTEDGESLVVNSESSLTDPAADQNVCPTDPDALCESVENAGAYLPNETFGQIVATSN